VHFGIVISSGWGLVVLSTYTSRTFWHLCSSFISVCSHLWYHHWLLQVLVEIKPRLSMIWKSVVF